MTRHAIKLLPALLAALSITAAARRYEPPTMGWSSWNTYRVGISAGLIVKQADAMAAQGLKAAGYRYINIDDGYFGGRDAEGNLLVHSGRFPDGLKPVVDHIHALGFKAGIYSDAGRNTCGSFWDGDASGVGVGLYGHDRQDADFFFSRLGFDFIKVDFCGGDAAQNADGLALDERERYTAIRRAIDQTGRSVRLNICRWAFPGTWAREVASSWRIDADIAPAWGAVKRIIASNRYLSAYATAGRYNDMDMLEIGRGLTEAEERTHFGLWCIQSSPLLIGCDLTAIPEKSLALLKNEELIAINQDPLALQAYVAREDSGVTLYVKDIHRLHGKTRAVALYNATDAPRRFTLRMGDIDLGGKARVRDAFARKDLPAAETGEMTVTLPPHDTRVFVLTAARRLERTLYEAETAWLERFQRIGKNNRLGYAAYADDAACSGGGKVVWLGSRADNFMEWRDVRSRRGGAYTLTLRYLTDEDRTVELSVNGGAAQTVATPHGTPGEPAEVSVSVKLRRGRNTIRIGNAKAWCPDIDCITLRPETAHE